jgi:uncharacterized protein
MLIRTIATTPVKGLGLNHPEQVHVTERGVVGDRRYALVDASGVLANGKKFGTLMRVTASCADGPETLVLALPDGTRVGGEVTLGEPIDTVFYGRTRPATRVLGAYSEALSDVAGEALTLVRMPDGGGIDRVDVGAVSLLTTASLEALRRAVGADEPVDGSRFRMTFTIDGADEHEEDSWIGREVRIGEAVVEPVGHIGRCVVTTRNPASGESDLDTLKALARYRGQLETTERLAFGVHAKVLVPGRVAVGDPVHLVNGERSAT